MECLEKFRFEGSSARGAVWVRHFFIPPSFEICRGRRRTFVPFSLRTYNKDCLCVWCTYYTDSQDDQVCSLSYSSSLPSPKALAVICLFASDLRPECRCRCPFYSEGLLVSLVAFVAEMGLPDFRPVQPDNDRDQSGKHQRDEDDQGYKVLIHLI